MDDVEKLYNKAANVSKLGRYEEAIKYYDKVLEIDPHHIDSLYFKGLALSDLGRYEEALNPESLRALISKGNALSKLGLYEDAVAYHDKALAVDPNAIGIVHNKAFALLNPGRYNEAFTFPIK